MEENKDRSRMEFLKNRHKSHGQLIYGKLLENAFSIKDFALPVVLMVFDMQSLLVIHVTPNCEQVWGYTREEMEWRGIEEMIHPEDRVKSLSLADESIEIEGKTIIRYKNRHFNKAGEVIYLQWTVTQSYSYQALCFIEKISREGFEVK